VLNFTRERARSRESGDFTGDRPSPKKIFYNWHAVENMFGDVQATTIARCNRALVK
jgi:hypothetical protein